MANKYGLLLIVGLLLSVVCGSVRLEHAWISSGKISRDDAAGSGVIWVPDNYTSIQAAINAANSGDTIYVGNGSYYENIIVNQTVRLAGIDFPTIDGQHYSMFGLPTLRVRANNVTVNGFIIQHGSSLQYVKEFDWGIDLGCNGSNISGNIIRFNERGIDSFGSNAVENNLIIYNYGGIACDGSYNIIKENNVTKNYSGIFFAQPSNTAFNNTILDNDAGIILYCNDTYLRGNNITGSLRGFDFDGGYDLDQYVQDIDTSNLIDGRPMYYWTNQCDKTVPPDAGYVALVNCTSIIVNGLNLERNGHGVLMAGTSNSTIVNCNFTDNVFGLFAWASENNTIYHNNFVNNTFQVGNTYSWWPPAPELLPSTWDNGYPSGGNYWSNCSITDAKNGVYQSIIGSDGINDTSYTIDSSNEDSYPFAAPFHSFDVGTWNNTHREVSVVSNSSLSSFQLNQTEKTIGFNVTGSNDAVGFCRVTVPNPIVQEMWQGNYTILVNNQPVSFENWTDTENTYIYLTYQHSERKITIIPEFPPTTVLPLVIILAPTTLLTRRRKSREKPKS